jgi:SAM-dependent methyltransferase
MSNEARLTGVDRELRWIQQASERAAERGLAERFTFRQGEAEHLPFAADSFDFTTCQTVLIHLPNPSAALAEMMRVTKPGGLVAVAEPNNLSETLLLDSISNQASIADILDIVRLQLTCERGKVALGEGDNSLGDRVPGLFAELGFSEIEVHVNDKATAIFPPYAGDAQRLFIADERDRATRGVWNWTEAETRRLYLAGGGNEADFRALFSNALAARQNVVRGLDARTYHGVIGGEFYLVSGRKREDTAVSGNH